MTKEQLEIFIEYLKAKTAGENEVKTMFLEVIAGLRK